MKKSLQPARLTETLSLFGFACFLLYLPLSGKDRLFLSGKSRPWLLFAALLLLALGASSIRSLFRPLFRPRYAHCLVLMLPLLFFCLPVPDLRGAEYSGRIAVWPAEVPEERSLPTGAEEEGIPLRTEAAGEFNDGSDYAAAEPDAAWQKKRQEAAETETAGRIPEDGVIRMNSENHAAWIRALYASPEKFEGVKWEELAYVYAMAPAQDAPAAIPPAAEPASATDENRFAAARLTMICCAADMASSGIVSCNLTGKELDVGKYYRFRGELQAEEVPFGDGQSPGPVAYILEAAEAEPPEPEWVLP